jgi:hypothetical protein
MTSDEAEYERNDPNALPLDGDTELSKMVDGLMRSRSLPIEDYFRMDDSSLEHKLITSVSLLTFEGKMSYASFLANEILEAKGITRSGREFASLFKLFAESRDTRILFDLGVKLGFHKIDTSARMSPMDVEYFFTTVLVSMIKVFVISVYSNMPDLKKHSLSGEVSGFLIREGVNQALGSHAEVIRMEYMRTFN